MMRFNSEEEKDGRWMFLSKTTKTTQKKREEEEEEEEKKPSLCSVDDERARES